ncbi:MAG: type II toxin-antitoxin system HicB family antitoxin [Pasteurella sp.]|nr:type II toxin-antitoxin system HicB family antitoxin [Pasteurella sp.]
MSTNNIMKFGKYKAIINYDPDIEMFRGEFIGLNGGADFYADNIHDLKKEGDTSLKVFLDMCKEEGITPQKSYSGRFNVRIPPAIHEKVVVSATAENKSLNQWITDTLTSHISTV